MKHIFCCFSSLLLGWTLSGSLEAVTPSISAGENHSIFLKSDGSVWTTGKGVEGQLGQGGNADVSSPSQVLTGGIAISGGVQHSLFLKADDSVWGTGSGGNGQLGDGTNGSFNTPTQVLSGYQAIEAGGFHSLFLKADHTAWATGDNSAGQLGNGTLTGQNAPVQVMTNVQTVSAGRFFSLFLKTNGEVWAAGDNGYGQLGDGTTTQRQTPVLVMSGVQAISAGLYHSLFLKTDNTVWAAGYNALGCLGDGSQTDRSIPVQVLTGVQSISAGNFHSLFLNADGTVLATGLNSSGQLGNNSTGLETTPIEVDISDVQSVSAGGYHSLFIKNSLEAWATGKNDLGQLGDGLTADVLVPKFIINLDASAPPVPTLTTPVVRNVSAMTATLGGTLTVNTPFSLVDKIGVVIAQTSINPNPTLGGLGTTEIEAPLRAFLGEFTVDTSDLMPNTNYTFRAYCTNANGTGYSLAATFTTPACNPDLALPAIAAGNNHSLYLKSDGTVWSVGDNYGGQLGDGTRLYKTVLRLVMSGVKAIAAGSASIGTHSLFLKTDGTVWAVGENGNGELGDGTTDDKEIPIQILTGVKAISAGRFHSLFLKTDGSVWATGSNFNGRLGNGLATGSTLTPVQVLTGVQAISAGGNHSLFLKTNGSLWATGENAHGQLGLAPSAPVLTPVQVVSNGVQAISAGLNHSLYINSLGTAWAMGSNSDGQIGNGSSSLSVFPAIQVMTSVKAIAAAETHSLFLKANGTAWATGDNFDGRLGDNTGVVKYSPVQVFTNVQAIAAGSQLSIFFKTDGTAWATGYNGSGFLGAGPAPNFVLAPIQVLQLNTNQGFLWQQAQFVGDAGNPAISAWTADPDKDGIPNLLERAFNLSPNLPDSTVLTANNGTTGLPRVTNTIIAGNRVVSLEYIRLKNAHCASLSYTPQFSNGLVSWQNAMGFETVTSIDSVWERVTLSDTISGQPKRFCRVKVETP